MKNESGQTLIEVIAALTAAVIIISAIVSASLNSLNNSEFTRDQNIAAQYNQQGIELIRDMRNQDVASLSATYLPDGTYCLASSCTSLHSDSSACWQMTGLSCNQNVDKFVREVVVLHNSADCNATPTPMGGYLPQILSANIKITVSTSWYDNKCTDSSHPFCHSVTASTCFSDFTALPTP